MAQFLTQIISRHFFAVILRLMQVLDGSIGPSLSAYLTGSILVDKGRCENVCASRIESARDFSERGRGIEDVFHYVLRDNQVE